MSAPSTGTTAKTAVKPGSPDDPFTLGLDVNDPLGVHQRLLEGVKFIRFVKLAEACNLTRKELAHVIGTSQRTLARREKEKLLHPDESDRLNRLASLYRHAIRFFNGDKEAAKRWMSTPRPALRGGIPLELARTEVGARQVEVLLTQLEHGVYV